MVADNIPPNAVSITSVIKACGAMGAFNKGREIHMKILQSGTELGLSVANTFISMYAKCGALSNAQQVLYQIPMRDVVSWTALIAGYAEHGPAEEALKCFSEMQSEHISPNEVTFACVLRACGSIGDLQQGQKIHTDVVKEEFESLLTVGNSLIGMYTKCDSLVEAHEIFDDLLHHDEVSWTTLISGYAENGPSEEALKCFDQMLLAGIHPDAVTYACCMKACSSIGATSKGCQLHAEIAKDGLEGDITINNTLIAMYTKLNLLSEAEDIFNGLQTKSVFSWTALIGGYAENGYDKEVINCFERMNLEGVPPDDVTYCCVLKVCGNSRILYKGREIHMEVAHRKLDKDISVGKTLVGMYAKCGSLSKARAVFEKLSVHDTMLWTAMISGYAEHGSAHEALNCFKQMQREHVCPNSITYVCAVKACGAIGALDKSQELHNEIIQKGFENDTSVGNSVISTYARCAAFPEAWSVFHKLQVQDLVSWSAMIKGYSLNHESLMAVQCFENMQKLGVKPDAITFICLLAACDYNSMVTKGQNYFQLMEEVYGITPTVEHHNCMVDLLSRSGYLNEAENFIEVFSSAPEQTWLALLSSCKMYGDEEVAIRCFQRLVKLNPEDATWYVIMADIYASSDKWVEAWKIEEQRKLAGAEKKPAVALIEINNQFHEFIVGNREEYAGVNRLWLHMRSEGYVPDIDQINLRIQSHV